MNLFDNHSDQQLVALLRQGDPAAFHELYDRYKREITVKLLGLLKDDDLVQDTLQELFIKIWELREQIKPEQSIAAFLHTVARNMAVDIFRKASRDERLIEQLSIGAVDRVSSIEDSIIDKETYARLQEALAQLPDRQRQVFMLHKIEGKSYKEISEALSISEAAINQHIYRAKQGLIKILNSRTWTFLIGIL